MEEIIELIKDDKSIRYEIINNNLIIYNLNNNMIEIMQDNNEYIITFSTEHRHFENDFEEIGDYLNSIMNDEILPIEFFLNGKDFFGGEISKEHFDNLSTKFLSNYFGCSKEYISKLEYEIHSWSGKYDIKKTSVSNLRRE